MPRAFEPSRPTPPSSPAPDFELLTRSEPSRAPIVPVLIGVAAGLIVGLAGGYWLGTRNAAPAVALPAQTVASGQPAPARGALAGATPPAVPKPVMQEAVAPAGESSTAPAAPPPTAAAPTAVARGSITVTAAQQANVYLDGQLSGLTPRNLRDVPLGSHTVRVTRPGYAAQEQTVVLTSEEPAATMTFTLRPETAAPPPAASRPATATKAPVVASVLIVLIESTPVGARIRIDGRDLGPAPLTVRQLRPGTHTIELRMPGYRTWSQRLTVAAGDNRRITASLERDIAR